MKPRTARCLAIGLTLATALAAGCRGGGRRIDLELGRDHEANALRCREAAVQELSEAYGSLDRSARREAFRRAAGLYVRARDEYYRALEVLPEADHTRVQEEIDRVQDWLVRCERDRPMD